MQTTLLGHTGVAVSRLCYGTISFGLSRGAAYGRLATSISEDPSSCRVGTPLRACRMRPPR